MRTCLEAERSQYQKWQHAYRHVLLTCSPIPHTHLGEGHMQTGEELLCILKMRPAKKRAAAAAVCSCLLLRLLRPTAA